MYVYLTTIRVKLAYKKIKKINFIVITLKNVKNKKHITANF